MKLIAGDRVRLVRMVDDPDPIPVGAEGTVRSVTPIWEFNQVDVEWDNGRKLMLSIPPDVVTKISEDDALDALIVQAFIEPQEEEPQ